MKKALRDIFLLVFVAGTCHGCTVEEKLMTHDEKTAILRNIHPMPQNINMGKHIYKVPPAECGAVVFCGLSGTEKLFVDNFRKKWEKRFGCELGNGRTGKSLNIVIMRADDKTTVSEKEKKIIDFDYLANRSNAEQAYCIKALSANGATTVYVTANDSKGLYYALLTLCQIAGREKDSSGGTLVSIPEITIYDWPDLKERGTTLTPFDVRLELKEPSEFRERIQKYSALKLNMFYGNFISLGLDREKKIVVSYPNDVFPLGHEFNVDFVPVLIHLEQLFNWRDGLWRDIYKNTLAEPAGKETKAHPFCYRKQETQTLFNNIFEEMAVKIRTDRMAIWLTEIENDDGACHCPNCKGNKREHFINEIKTVVNAWNAAKKINPRLKLDICLTQGTSPFNTDLMKYIPDNATIKYYDAFNTYQNEFMKGIIPPSISEIIRNGKSVVAVPTISGCMEVTSQYMFPWQAPLFIKLRMSEIIDQGCAGVCAWLGNTEIDLFELEAMAEFSWNRRGRTPGEFAESWAYRHNMETPRKVAEIIEMLEYPERALSNSSGTWKGCSDIAASIKKMARDLSAGGKCRTRNFQDDPIAGFQYQFNYCNRYPEEELDRVLNTCRLAYEMSSDAGDKQFRAGVRLMLQWIEIYKCYASIVSPGKAQEKRNLALREMQEHIRKLPEIWKPYFDESGRKLPERWKNLIESKVFPDLMKAFAPIMELKELPAEK